MSSLRTLDSYLRKVLGIKTSYAIHLRMTISCSFFFLGGDTLFLTSHPHCTMSPSSIALWVRRAVHGVPLSGFSNPGFVLHQPELQINFLVFARGMLNATGVRKAKNVCICTHTYLYLFLYLSLHTDNMSLKSCREFHFNTIRFIRPFTLSDLYSPSPVVRRLPSHIYRNLFVHCSSMQTVSRPYQVAVSHRIFPLWSSSLIRLPCICAPVPSLNQQSGSQHFFLIRNTELFLPS